MFISQQTNSGTSRRRPCRPVRRIGAAVFFLATAAGAAVLWLSANGHIHLGFWMGVCGFKQRRGLPCPGCGWTGALEALLTGHPIEAFIAQPAAVFFYVSVLAAAVYALLVAVFGIHFSVFKRLVEAVGIKTLLGCAVIIFLAGWAVTLVRAMV